MTLSDIQNAVLFNLQQSELVNFGSDPLWATATNPPIDHKAMTFQINRAYTRVYVDLADCEIELANATFQSIANHSDYPLPPGTATHNYTNPTQKITPITYVKAPTCMRLMHVYYNPVGQPWTQDMEGGIRLVSWGQFMRFSSFGYLRPFTYNIIPDFCAVTPDRKFISFFPGTASTGDTVTIEYVPELTDATPFAPLQQALDTPVLPAESQDMLIMWATSLCWPKLREMQAAAEYQQLYKAEMTRVREQLGPRSKGDTFRFSRAEDGLWQSYPIGGALSLP